MNEPTRKHPQWNLEQEWAANRSETSFVSWLCAEIVSLRLQLEEAKANAADFYARHMEKKR